MSKTAPANSVTAAAAKQLASFIERADRLYDEIAELLKELWLDAKGVGYDAKELDAIVKMRRKDPNNEKIKTSVRDVYMKALQLERDLAESQLATQASLATMGASTQLRVDAFAVTRGMDESGEAAARLKEMAREDGGTCTISINGGPDVPMETVQRALRRVKPGKGKSIIGAMEEAVAEELAAASGEATP